MDRELDDLLEGTSPPTVQRTDDLRSALSALVADAEAAVMPRRRRFGRRLGIAGIVVAGVLGLGVAASATGLVEPPWATTATAPPSYPGPFIHANDLSSGTNCKVVFGAAELEEPKHPVSEQDRYDALQESRKYVRTFDLSGISVPDAIRDYRAEYAETVASEGLEDVPASQYVPEGSAGEIKMWAVLREVDRHLQAHLKSEGLSTHAASAVGIPECKVVATSDEFDDPYEERP